MTYYWIIPGNLKIFRITDYFSNNDIVDWKQSHYKFSVGDIVFLYVSSPISSIRYMLEVIKTDIPFEESINDSEYWTSKHPVAKEVKNYKYVRLKLLKRSDSPALHIDALSNVGIKVPQGATHRFAFEQIDYILKQF